MLFVRTLQPLGHQKTMKAKFVIAFVFLIMVWVSVARVEYDLIMRFGILFNALVSVFALFVLLGALLGAPEGYEDETAFHIGALADAALR
jgi:NADH:ubiquinone oxidoreductase subunit H